MWAPMVKVTRFLSLRTAASRERNRILSAHPTNDTAAEQLTRELARTRQSSAMVAHEMRNLMAPLVYGAELLGRTDDKATAQKVRHDILVSVAHLRRLVDDLLNIGGCEQHRMALVNTLLDLRDVVSTSVDLVLPMFPTRGHRIDMVVDSDHPVMVKGDFCRLTQVISNLLINAAKFTPDGGDILVTLSHDPRRATIKVRDSGIGIAREDLTHIFDPFSRLNADTEDSTNGLGLGLAIARQLVQLHGGELTVSSAGKGSGSEFVIRLPLVVPS